MRGARRVCAALALASLAGCAGAAAEAPDKAQTSVMPRQRARAAPAEEHAPLDEFVVEEPLAESVPEPAVAEPYGGRAGGAGAAEGPPPRFVAPSRELRVVAPGRRRSWSTPQRLAVAVVRGGEVARDVGGAVAALEDRLADDAEVAGVWGAPGLREAAVDLGDLAAAADRAGRDLLLVDVRGPDEEVVAVGYLVDARGADGSLEAPPLLARVVVRGADEALALPATAGPSDLIERVALAYRRAVLAP